MEYPLWVKPSPIPKRFRGYPSFGSNGFYVWKQATPSSWLRKHMCATIPILTVLTLMKSHTFWHAFPRFPMSRGTNHTLHKNCHRIQLECVYTIAISSYPSISSDLFLQFINTHGDGSKPWYLVNPKIAGSSGCSSHYSNVSIGIDPYPTSSPMGFDRENPADFPPWRRCWNSERPWGPPLSLGSPGATAPPGAAGWVWWKNMGLIDINRNRNNNHIFSSNNE